MKARDCPGSLGLRATASPASGDDRSENLDLLRGVALGGILIANIRQLALPWSIADAPLAITSSPALVWLDWIAFDALIDFKFITIFSFVFGISFGVITRRLQDRGQPIATLYLRRLSLLALIGAAHGLLLYPAEVLLLYAVTGAVLLAFSQLQPATMMRIGLGMLTWSTLWIYQISGIGVASIRLSALAAIALIVSLVLLRNRSWRLSIATVLSIVVVCGLSLTLRLGTASPTPSERADFLSATIEHRAMLAGDMALAPSEYRVRQDGNWSSLLQLHRAHFQEVLTYLGLVLFWRTLAVFLVGTGLYRSQVFNMLPHSIWRRRSWQGLIIGVMLSVIASLARAAAVAGLTTAVWSHLLHQLSALLFAAILAGLVLSRRASGDPGWCRTRLAAVGRTALSNYVLGQPLCLAAIFEPWGLGLYAQFDGPQLTAMSIAWILVLGELSFRWLQTYRYGPLEWLWRCGTYCYWLPIRR